MRGAGAAVPGRQRFRHLLSRNYASAGSSAGVASRAGQTVRIAAGAFAGKLALFAGMERHERVAVLLAALSSQMRVTLPQRHVAAI